MKDRSGRFMATYIDKILIKTSRILLPVPKKINYEMIFYGILVSVFLFRGKAWARYNIPKYGSKIMDHKVVSSSCKQKYYILAIL